ncbi:esterase EstB [bacterium BMS3Bbin02]|nr:esterase EstB [bacterium BMS3Bbin02]
MARWPQTMLASASRLRIYGLIAWALVSVVVIADSIPAAGSVSELADEQILGRTIADFDVRIPQLMATYDVPGVGVALVQHGTLVWSNAYGYANVDAADPMTVEAVVRAESISKSVTAWGVMRLVERGLVDLDDPVAGYLRRSALANNGFPDDDLTLRQLLSHTAGMPLGTIGVEYSPHDNVPTLDENLLQEAHLVREPGTSFSYSNVGFDVLELVIEEVTGENFARYMDREVLQPLGMSDSSFAWSEDFARAVPTGYDLRGRPVPPYVYPAKASGGLFTTVEDLGRFVSAGMAAPSSSASAVLELGSIEQMYTPTVKISGLFRFVTPAYGLGYFVEDLPSGERVVWHGGQGSGWMTDFHGIPETGDGIVIVSNSQRSWPLIAHVLLMWTEASGLGPVGFSNIVAATRATWLLVGSVLLVSLWQLWRVGTKLRSGHRAVAPLARRARFARFGEAFAGIGLIGILVWGMSQDYLFVSSVFPTATSWLGIATAALAVVLLLSAATPPTCRRSHGPERSCSREEIP